MKRWICFLLALLLPLCLLSCRSASKESAADRLDGWLSEIGTPPAGAVYLSSLPLDGENGAARPLSEELVTALYARADGTCEYSDRVEEAAVYLSSRPDLPFEAAVLLCYGSADTEAVAAMCLRRVRLLSQNGLADPESARIECRGRAVYFLICGK